MITAFDLKNISTCKVSRDLKSLKIGFPKVCCDKNIGLLPDSKIS